MDTALLAREMLETLTTVNKRDFLTKYKLLLKGEDLFLIMLSEMGGMSTPSKLAEDSDFSPARLSAIIKALENKGYIEKAQNELDKRCSIIEITDVGSAHVQKIIEEAVRNSLSIVENMGEADAAEFIRLTKKLLSIVCDL